MQAKVLGVSDLSRVLIIKFVASCDLIFLIFNLNIYMFYWMCRFNLLFERIVFAITS